MSVEEAKNTVGQRAVENHVTRDGMNIGIGSGSTVIYVVKHLAALCKTKNWTMTCVPTSFQARELIVDNGLTLSDLDSTPSLDVAFDGADECDAQLNLIKGGGGCLFQEKLVANAAESFIVVADYRKDSALLGQQWRQGVPIEVVPLARVPVLTQIKAMPGCVSAIVRTGTGKAGPVVTDNGNFIIDADFGEIAEPAQLDVQLRNLIGVLETGLFIGMASTVYFGNKDGSVTTKE